MWHSRSGTEDMDRISSISKGEEKKAYGKRKKLGIRCIGCERRSKETKKIKKRTRMVRNYRKSEKKIILKSTSFERKIEKEISNVNAKQESSSDRFFLAHVVFDEDHGPTLKSFMSKEIEIPKIILQGVTTTLFTMAVGVGEPTGEPDTAIIPINVTGIQGRVLIHSFAIDDPNARGKNRIESFMIFIPRAHQDKLLQHSYAFSNILQTAIHDIQVENEKGNEEFPLDNIFTNIKKILMTRIDNTIQDRISAICTDKESVIISDGTVRAIHNIVLTPEIISLVNKIPHLLKIYSDQLKRYGTFFDALPIEVHGKTHSNQQFYLIAIENNFIMAFSSGKGRLGSLFRSFREILWDLNLQESLETTYLIPSFSINYQDKSDEWKDNKFLDLSFEILKNFTPIINNISLLRCDYDTTRIESLKLTDREAVKKHALVCSVFTVLHQLCEKLFRTPLIQIVLSQHGFNSIALRWAMSNKHNNTLFMVGDSVRGVGLLKLVGDQILEHKTEFEPSEDGVHIKPVSD